MAERWVALTASIPGLHLAVPNRFIALNSADSILHRIHLVGYFVVVVLHFTSVRSCYRNFLVCARLYPARQTKRKTKITEASHSTAR